VKIKSEDLVFSQDKINLIRILK